MKNTGFRFQDSGFSIRKTNNVSILQSEKGIVLVVSLLLLLVATVVGITALSTSTTNVMITGNLRLNEVNFNAAESGVEISTPVMRDPESANYTAMVVAPLTAFQDELYCVSQLSVDTVDITTYIGANLVSVDVDFIVAGDPGPGYALEEGGTSSLFKKHYRINSTTTGVVGSSASAGAIYYIVGYCKS